MEIAFEEIKLIKNPRLACLILKKRIDEGFLTLEQSYEILKKVNYALFRL